MGARMSEDTFGKEYDAIKKLLGIETTLEEMIKILDRVDPSLRYSEFFTVRGKYRACLKDIMVMCQDALNEKQSEGKSKDVRILSNHQLDYLEEYQE